MPSPLTNRMVCSTLERIMNNILKSMPMGKQPGPVSLDDLKRRIRKLEGQSHHQDAAALPFGVAEIDAALPWGGFPAGGLHEMTASGPLAAAMSFAAALMGRMAGTVLWCRRGADLYGPGLSALGLTPERLIVTRAERERDLLWAMEEGLRSGALAAVLGEPSGASTVVLRRLQLAAEAGGTAAILLRPNGAKWAPGPALTHWRIGAAPSLGRWPDLPRWRVELVRCRGAGKIEKNRHEKPAKGSGSWLVEWREEQQNAFWDKPATHGFAVAAELRHGPVAPPSTWRQAS